MDKCQGVFGKLFGHSYRPAVTKAAARANLGSVSAPISAVISLVDMSRAEIYHGIYCKRCGKVING